MFGAKASPVHVMVLVAESTLELVDREIRRIVDECYATAISRLGRERDKLEALTQALLDKETLEEAQAYEVAGIARPTTDAG